VLLAACCLLRAVSSRLPAYCCTLHAVCCLLLA
jgi:hypothetical protein